MFKIKSKYPVAVILFLVLFIELFSYNISIANAATKKDIYIQEIEDIFQVNIVEDSKISLYDKNDTVIAYFYELEPVGYIIIDSITYGTIEYSTVTNNKYINDKSRVYYYSGPLSYFEASSLSDVEITDCKSHKKTLKNKIDFISKTSLKDEIENLSTDAISTYAAPTFLPYATQPYDTNIGDICGATAAAIMLEYYYSHIDSTIVYSDNITSDGQALTNLLAEYIPANASVFHVDLGLDDYLKSVFNTRSASHVTLLNIITSPTAKMQYCIANEEPCIIGLTGHPTYGEHWVVATGYDITLEFATINDGWGNRGIQVKYSYIDSCVYLN